MCRRLLDRFKRRVRIASPSVVVQTEASWSKMERRGPKLRVVVQGPGAYGLSGGWWTGARARTPLERLRHAPWVPERCSLLGGSEVRPSESAESSGAAEAPTRAHKPSPRPHPFTFTLTFVTRRIGGRSNFEARPIRVKLRPHSAARLHDALSCCPLPAAPRPARCPPPGRTCAQVEWASGAAGAGRSASAARPARIGPTAPRSPRSPI